MIVETSALVAILRAEPDAEALAHAIEAAPVRRMSAASYVEVGAVIDGARDPVASRRVDELIEAAGIVIEPLTASQPSVRAWSRSTVRARATSSVHTPKDSSGAVPRACCQIPSGPVSSSRC